MNEESSSRIKTAAAAYTRSTSISEIRSQELASRPPLKSASQHVCTSKSVTCGSHAVICKPEMNFKPARIYRHFVARGVFVSRRVATCSYYKDSSPMLLHNANQNGRGGCLRIEDGGAVEVHGSEDPDCHT